MNLWSTRIILKCKAAAGYNQQLHLCFKRDGREITDAEPFIAGIVIRKLGNDGLRYYEQNVKKTKEIQSLDDVLSFLEEQVQVLEAVTKRQGNKFQKKRVFTATYIVI